MGQLLPWAQEERVSFLLSFVILFYQSILQGNVASKGVCVSGKLGSMLDMLGLLFGRKKLLFLFAQDAAFLQFPIALCVSTMSALSANAAV